MAKSLVTGGAGFMGSHVAEHLICAGNDVVVLDDLSGGFRENVPSGVTFVEGSITDHELVDRIFDRHSFDHVYHLAAYAAEGLSHFIKRFNYNNNLIGSGEPDKCIRESRREAFCVHFFNSSLRCGPKPNVRGNDSCSRRFIWYF